MTGRCVVDHLFLAPPGCRVSGVKVAFRKPIAQRETPSEGPDRRSRRGVVEVTNFSAMITLWKLINL